MSKLIGLPFDFDQYEAGTHVIDMGNTSFETDNDERSAFLFIRNMQIQPVVSFQHCSVERIERYLMEYMFGDINVNISFLTVMWIEILLNDITNECRYPPALNKEQIGDFIHRHQDDVDKVRNVIASLPLVSIQGFVSNDDSIESTDDEPVNFRNLLNMIDCDDFMLVFSNCLKSPPKFYRKYFSQQSGFARHINANLPFMHILSGFLNINKQDAIINAIGNMYASKEKECEKCDPVHTDVQTPTGID